MMGGEALLLDQIQLCLDSSISLMRTMSRYKVKGWRLKPLRNIIPHKPSLRYEVDFERMDACNVEEFLKHPLADELDDYRDYKSIISGERARAKRATPRRAKGPKVAPSTPPVVRRQGVAVQPVLGPEVAPPGTSTPSTASARSVIISHEGSSKDISHPGRNFPRDGLDGVAEEDHDFSHDWPESSG
jgi:hypothetical protein